MSLVPRRFGRSGYPLTKPDVMLQDAQGAQVNVSGMRRIELALLGAESEVQCNIGESFVVAGVTNILVQVDEDGLDSAAVGDSWRSRKAGDAGWKCGCSCLFQKEQFGGESKCDVSSRTIQSSCAVCSSGCWFQYNQHGAEEGQMEFSG